MGMPALHPPITTIEKLLALPDDGLRHELLDGVHVVTPAPSLLHQRTLRALLEHLRTVLTGRAEVEMFWSPADVVLGPRTLVQPDLFVVRRTPGQPLKRWADVGIPLLAIEVLSPTTAPRDRGAKRRIYQRAGVGEYWIADPDARTIEVLQLRGGTYAAAGYFTAAERLSSPTLPGLAIPLAPAFA